MFVLNPLDKNTWSPVENNIPPPLPLLKSQLRGRGCSGCYLGLQRELLGPVLYRGNPDSHRLILGEAPGKVEDRKSQTFVGPAGELLDKIWAFAGWDTNEDWILSNTVMCRPIAEKGSGRENLAPSTECKIACRPYLDYLIQEVKPRIIVLVGGVAIFDFFPELSKLSVKSIVGKVKYHQDYPNIPFFTFYHPSYVLRQKNMPAKYPELRDTIIEHMNNLKALVSELEN